MKYTACHIACATIIARCKHFICFYTSVGDNGPLYCKKKRDFCRIILFYVPIKIAKYKHFNYKHSPKVKWN